MFHFIFKTFNEYLFNAYSVPNTVWGTRKPEMNKTKKGKPHLPQ